MVDEKDSSKFRVQSAARTIDVLVAVAGAESSGISAGAISEKLGLPRQVVYHLAHTLAEMNILRKVGRGSYALGPKVAPIVLGFKRQVTSSDMVVSLAERAAKATGETAYVVGWLESEIVVLGTARGSGIIQAAEVPIGTAGYAHARASGKLLLAMAGDGDVKQYLSDHPLARRTPNTITSQSAFFKEIARIRQTWVSREGEEYEVGLSCLAVPLGPPPTLLALGISAPTARLEDNFEAKLAALQKVAATF